MSRFCAATFLICATTIWPAVSHANFAIKPITINGSTDVDAEALNNRGMMTGTVCTASSCQGYIDTAGAVTLLPPPGANCSAPCAASPTSINADGDVVGYFYNGMIIGFLWHAGRYVQGGYVALGTGGAAPRIAVNRHGEEVFDSIPATGYTWPMPGRPGISALSRRRARSRS